jgi:hypothetical protein
MSTTILDEFLDPMADCLPPDVARRIVEMQPRPGLLQRLEALRDKANEGTLTPAERADYEEFIESMDLVAILKSKARVALSRQSS